MLRAETTLSTMPVSVGGPRPRPNDDQQHESCPHQGNLPGQVVLVLDTLSWKALVFSCYSRMALKNSLKIIPERDPRKPNKGK